MLAMSFSTIAKEVEAMQDEREQDTSTPRAPITVFHTFPQLPRPVSALASGGSRPARRSAAARVQLQPAPTEDPAKRLDQAVSTFSFVVPKTGWHFARMTSHPGPQSMTVPVSTALRRHACVTGST